MNRSWTSLLIATFLLSLAVACQTKQAEPDTTEQQAAEAPAKKGPPQKADPACIGAPTTGTPEKLELAGRTWEMNGSTLKLVSPLQGDALVIGALTDIKETTPENKANLEAFLSWFATKKVDLVVVAGDSGENQAQMTEAMEILAKADVPVLNIIGNREGKTDYRNAMVAARAKHSNIFDLNVIRRIDTPVADIVSLPGYFNPSYIHNDDGCPYFEADLVELKELVATCDSPVVVVSHGGPAQEGPEGIDRTAEGANVGDPKLTEALTAAKVPFGIFGNIHEAGGRATDLSGKTKIAPKTEAAALYLNPGPADGVRWGMNDGTESIGMAAIMTLSGGKASYEIYRVEDTKVAKAGKARPKKKAKK